jgi:hypothetical protein
MERKLRGVKIVRRRGRAIRLFTWGSAVGSHDYIADIERRFDDWAKSPEPPTAQLAVPFRASDQHGNEEEAERHGRDPIGLDEPEERPGTEGNGPRDALEAGTAGLRDSR